MVQIEKEEKETLHRNSRTVAANLWPVKEEHHQGDARSNVHHIKRRIDSQNTAQAQYPPNGPLLIRSAPRGACRPDHAPEGNGTIDPAPRNCLNGKTSEWLVASRSPRSPGSHEDHRTGNQ